MKIRYIIDYRFDESVDEFLQIGVWMHNPVEGDMVVDTDMSFDQFGRQVLQVVIEREKNATAN